MIFKKSFVFKEFKVEINLSNLQYQNKNVFIFGSAINEIINNCYYLLVFCPVINETINTCY